MEWAQLRSTQSSPDEQNHSVNPQTPEKKINDGCFKPLSLEMVYYTVIAN